MELAALTSGGKDSLYAVYLAMKEGHEVKYLLSMKPEGLDSYMFHHPNIELTELQAKLMNIPLLTEKTLGVKEEELQDLMRLISRVKDDVEGILTGAIASNYQRERIERICERLDLECISPLWQIDPERYWSDLLDAGFKVMVVSVSAEGLDEEWLGRIIDERALNELKELNRRYKIHLSFEGGEAETLVLDCPTFKKGIGVVDAHREWDGLRGTYTVKKTELVEKPLKKKA